jgi:hypothetical protein
MRAASAAPPMACYLHVSPQFLPICPRLVPEVFSKCNESCEGGEGSREGERRRRDPVVNVRWARQSASNTVSIRSFAPSRLSITFGGTIVETMAAVC